MRMTAMYVVRVRARFRLCVRVYATAMYVARMRTGTHGKSDISDMRLAPVGKITNTNPKRETDKIGQNTSVLRSVLIFP